MAATKVPKFGEWEGGENYTVYFDEARKKKNNGQIINPNDPEDYPEMFEQNASPAQPPRADPKGRKNKVPQFGAWDDGQNVGYTEYFEKARKTKNGDSNVSESEPQMNRDMQGSENVRKNKTGQAVNPEPSDASKVVTFKEGRSKVPQFGGWNGGEEAAYTAYFDNARKQKGVGPVVGPGGGPKQKDDQDDHQLRNASKGSNSSENGRYGRQNPGGQSPYNQKGGKLQPKSHGSRGSQTPEKGAAVPAWGVWNTDPQQAEGFTGAFTRAKEERNTPLNAKIPQRYAQQPNKQDETKKRCCFGWF